MDARVKIASPATLSRESAFNTARSHSRLVRFLKFAVPTLAFSGAALFVFFAWFNPFRAENVKVDIGGVGVSGGVVTMELPHLTGFNKRQQHYNVTAKSAAQKITAPGLIDLTSLEAVISMADKSKATLTAATGKFDSNAEILSLLSAVRVQSTKGYDATLQSGIVDFKAGTVKSTDPVTVNLSNGTIDANGLNIVEGGAKITFQGGVHARFKTPLKPQADATASSPADQTGSTSPAPINPAQESPSP